MTIQDYIFSTPKKFFEDNKAVLCRAVARAGCISGGGGTITLTTTGSSGAATLVGTTLNIPQYSGGGGSGTVTSVAVTTANGVSGTVANGTTAAAITISLGAITPSSVAASGTVTGSNLSGTNTGDQTTVSGNAATATALQNARTINGTSFDGTANITVAAAAGTLTGTTLNATVVTSSLTAIGTIVTGVWNGTTIAVANGGTGTTTSTGSGDNVLSSSPTLTTPVINGLATGTGITSNATASTIVTRDANGNINANSFNHGYATTATAAGTTTLTVGSANLQYFTGSTTQTVVLPVTSTLVLGQRFIIVNNSSGLVTINSSGGSAVVILAAGTSATLVCILTSGTTAASWDAKYLGDIYTSGKLLSINNSITLAGTDATVMTFPTTSATIARTDVAQTFQGNQTFAGNSNIFNASSATIRTTNGGSNISTQLMFDVDGSSTVAASQAFGFETGVGFFFSTANGSRRIVNARMKLASVVTSAGNESADLAFYTQAAGAAASERFRITSGGGFTINATNTAGGTTGARTIDKPSGTVNFAAAATTLVVTNALVTAASLVFAVVRTNDSTSTIKNVVCSAGSFTITLTAAATAETSVGFFVIN